MFSFTCSSRSHPRSSSVRRDCGSFKNSASASTRSTSMRHVPAASPSATCRIEVDRVDADAEFLNEPQSRRTLDDLGCDRLEHVKKNIGVLQLARECVLVALVDYRNAQPVVLERRNLTAKAGRGAVLQDSLH